MYLKLKVKIHYAKSSRTQPKIQCKSGLFITISINAYIRRCGKCQSLCSGLDDDPGLINFSGISFSLTILGEGQTHAFLHDGDSEWAVALGQVFPALSLPRSGTVLVLAKLLNSSELPRRSHGRNAISIEGFAFFVAN